MQKSLKNIVSQLSGSSTRVLAWAFVIMITALLLIGLLNSFNVDNFTTFTSIMVLNFVAYVYLSKRTETASNESAYLKEVTRSVPIPLFIVDNNDVVRYFNGDGLKLSGFEGIKVTSGMKINEVFASNKEYCERFMSLLKNTRVRRTANFFIQEFAGNEDMTYIETGIYPSDRGTAVMLDDISDNIIKEKQLNHYKVHFRFLLENVYFYLVNINRSGMIMEMLDPHDSSADRYIGEHYSKYFQGDLCGFIDAYLNSDRINMPEICEQVFQSEGEGGNHIYQKAIFLPGGSSGINIVVTRMEMMNERLFDDMYFGKFSKKR